MHCLCGHNVRMQISCSHKEVNVKLCGYCAPLPWIWKKSLASHAKAVHRSPRSNTPENFQPLQFKKGTTLCLLSFSLENQHRPTLVVFIHIRGGRGRKWEANVDPPPPLLSRSGRGVVYLYFYILFCVFKLKYIKKVLCFPLLDRSRLSSVHVDIRARDVSAL